MFQQRLHGRRRPWAAPIQFRMFGPGTVLQGQRVSFNQMPNGVSVSIQKQNDEPAHITVQRGNDTWNIVGDDPASLAQLPEDVRPFVEQLLTGGGPMQIPLPAMPNITMPPDPPGAPLPPSLQRQRDAGAAAEDGRAHPTDAAANGAAVRAIRTADNPAAAITRKRSQ